MNSSSTTISLTAEYSIASRTQRILTQPLNLQTEPETTFLSSLRAAIVQFQGEVNRYLTDQMVLQGASAIELEDEPDLEDPEEDI